MRGSGRPPLVMASSSRPVMDESRSDPPGRPAARADGTVRQQRQAPRRRTGEPARGRRDAASGGRRAGADPLSAAQPSQVFSRSSLGPGERPAAGRQLQPLAPALSQLAAPVASARAAADTRNVWVGGLTGCVGAPQPAVRGGSSAVQPAASPEPACWPAFRRQRCSWRQQPTAISARPLRRTQARRGAAPRGSRARTGRWANACERGAAPRHPPAAPQPLRRAKPNALKMPQGRHFAPKRR